MGLLKSLGDFIIGPEKSGEANRAKKAPQKSEEGSGTKKRLLSKDLGDSIVTPVKSGEASMIKKTPRKRTKKQGILRALGDFVVGPVSPGFAKRINRVYLAKEDFELLMDVLRRQEAPSSLGEEWTIREVPPTHIVTIEMAVRDLDEIQRYVVGAFQEQNELYRDVLDELFGKLERVRDSKGDEGMEQFTQRIAVVMEQRKAFFQAAEREKKLVFLRQLLTSTAEVAE